MNFNINLNLKCLLWVHFHKTSSLYPICGRSPLHCVQAVRVGIVDLPILGKFLHKSF